MRFRSTYIPYIHPSPFAEAYLHFFIVCCYEGKTSWGAEPHCKDKMPNMWNKYSQKRNIGVSVPISTFMCLWANYIFPRWVCLFFWRKYVEWSWEYINRSQTHECGNCGWGRAIPRKGIYKRNCRCSARFELGHSLQQPSALPTELRCTLTELRCNLTDLRCTLAELRCTLISYFLQRFVAGCRENMPCIRRIWSYNWRTPLM